MWVSSDWIFHWPSFEHIKYLVLFPLHHMLIERLSSCNFSGASFCHSVLLIGTWNQELQSGGRQAFLRWRLALKSIPPRSNLTCKLRALALEYNLLNLNYCCVPSVTSFSQLSAPYKVNNWVITVSAEWVFVMRMKWGDVCGAFSQARPQGLR